MNDFQAVLRMMVCSDVHYKDEPSAERERFALAIETAYEIAQQDTQHPALDAIFVVGDFADRGSEIQMQAFAETLKAVKPETQVVLSTASHEYSAQNGGPEAAWEKLERIFGQQPDVHSVIHGFHCISVSPSHGCDFNQQKQSWVEKELKLAAEDAPQKPIFFFQHPHLTDTVYGSVDWGEDALIQYLMHYPQVIDFSGHSHAPINDPRSIHQAHFTSLGTGTLSYFELDEFDKTYGTVPPNAHNAAQMLIVEADAQNRVRVYPYDLITRNFFPMVWKIDTPHDPDSFTYTNARRKNGVAPYFPQRAAIRVDDITKTSCDLDFDQAEIAREYVNDYLIRIREKASGAIVRQLCIWSEYYFYEMPKTLCCPLDGLSSGTEYRAEIFARGFWGDVSEKPLTVEFCTK